jgi:hypothetical protein
MRKAKMQPKIKNPPAERRGIEDFSLKYLRLRGNKFPAPPGFNRPTGREIKRLRENGAE